jgi:hypothetical protein
MPTKTMARQGSPRAIFLMDKQSSSQPKYTFFWLDEGKKRDPGTKPGPTQKTTKGRY